METLSFDITAPGECMGGCNICVVGTLAKSEKTEYNIPIKVWNSIQAILNLPEYSDYAYTLSLSRISTMNWSSLLPLARLSPKGINIAIGV